MNFHSVPHGHDYWANMKKQLEIGFVYTSQYNGAYVTEGVTTQAVNTAASMLGIESTVTMLHYAAWDNSNLHFKLQDNIPPHMKPKHEFGNILNRMPVAGRTLCESIQESALAEAVRLKLAVKGSQDHPPTIGQQEYKHKVAKLSKGYLGSLRAILSSAPREWEGGVNWGGDTNKYLTKS